MNTAKWLNRFQEAHGHRPWALITGGSSGMGLEYARQLAEIGCNLLLVSNQREELEKVSESLKQDKAIQVIPHFQDLATESAAEKLFAFCQAEGLKQPPAIAVIASSERSNPSCHFYTAGKIIRTVKVFNSFLIKKLFLHISLSHNCKD